MAENPQTEASGATGSTASSSDAEGQRDENKYPNLEQVPRNLSEEQRKFVEFLSTKGLAAPFAEAKFDIRNVRNPVDCRKINIAFNQFVLQDPKATALASATCKRKLENMENASGSQGSSPMARSPRDPLEPHPTLHPVARDRP